MGSPWLFLVKSGKSLLFSMKSFPKSGNISGGFLKWYPQSSSNIHGIFHEINHPAMGDTPMTMKKPNKNSTFHAQTPRSSKANALAAWLPSGATCFWALRPFGRTSSSRASTWNRSWKVGRFHTVFRQKVNECVSPFVSYKMSYGKMGEIIEDLFRKSMETICFLPCFDPLK